MDVRQNIAPDINSEYDVRQDIAPDLNSIVYNFNRFNTRKKELASEIIKLGEELTASIPEDINSNRSS